MKEQRLTIICEAGKNHNNFKLVKCSCKCGNIVIRVLVDIKRMHTVSCGCYRKEVTSKRSKVHGHRGKKCSSEYNSWVAMLTRCYNENDSKYAYYGGRGIIVCERWRNSFKDFLDDMGLKPTSKHTIDRIKNDKGYEPGNCRWATRKEQSANRRKYATALKSVATKDLFD